MKLSNLMNEYYLPATINSDEEEEYFKIRIKATDALEKAGWNPQESVQMWDNYMHKYGNNMEPLESAKEVCKKLIELAKKRKESAKRTK